MFPHVPTNDPNQLLVVLSSLTSPRQGILIARTMVRMNKYDVATKQIRNPYVAIYKIAKTKVEVNGDYQQHVNDQRIVEGKDADFSAGPLPWGVAVNNVHIVNKTKPYVKFIQLAHDANPYYVDENGNAVNVELLRPFMPKYNPPKNQELEDTVDVRTYMLENIVRLQLGAQLIYERP